MRTIESPVYTPSLSVSLKAILSEYVSVEYTNSLSLHVRLWKNMKFLGFDPLASVI